MAEESAQTVLSVLFSHILPLVSGMEDALEQGASLLDLGCGRGRALLQLAERFPASPSMGFDLSQEAITFAREQAAERGLDNLTFEQRDLSTLDVDAEPEAFDFVTTFDAVHDQAKPLALLKGIRRTLKPGGDVSHAGHPGLEPPPREPRTSRRAAHVHDLDDALHDRLARAGR